MQKVKILGFPGMVNRKKIKYCGLFGGSFDPPHVGHVAVSRICAQLLSLDEIWWLVASKVPGKPEPCLARLKRMEMVNQLLQNASEAKTRILQVDIDVVHTFDLVRHVQQKYPDYRFCLIMGTDNFVNLHTWKDWISLCQHVPIVAVSRPGSESKVGESEVVKRFSGKRYECQTEYLSQLERKEIFEQLFHGQLPTWVFLDGLRLDVSSSQLKALQQ